MTLSHYFRVDSNAFVVDICDKDSEAATAIGVSRLIVYAQCTNINQRFLEYGLRPITNSCCTRTMSSFSLIHNRVDKHLFLPRFDTV